MDHEREDGRDMRPKKQFGQNFLTSEGALSAIVSAGDVGAGDLVIEIGPGKGALTAYLLEKGARVIAIEKDRDLIQPLTERFSKEIESGKLYIIERDVLDANISETVGEKDYKLIANIPYNITGQILRKFLEADHQPKTAVLLVQKEVAERIVAKDGKESILSVSVKTYASPKIILNVKAGSFFPKPKVDSAVIKLDSISKSFFAGFREDGFFRLIKAGFAQKRKMLMGNLGSLYSSDALASAFDRCGIARTARAEDVTLDAWQRLAAELEE